MPGVASAPDPAACIAVQVFPLRSGSVAGCRIKDGSMTRAHRFRVLRGDKRVHCGPCSSLKREKSDVDAVTSGLECGVVLDSFGDYRAGDVLQCYRIELVESPAARALLKQ